MTINIDKIYEYGKYSYVNFTQLSREDLLMILEWRNHPDIRKCMNTTAPITAEAHLSFCASLKDRNDRYYWLIKKGNQNIGVLNALGVNFDNSTCEPGFYLSPDVMGKGESIFVLSNYKSFLLNELGFENLVGHNYYDNMPALIFTMFFGGTITDVLEIDGRLSIQTVLTKDTLQNGEGTEKLILKYTKFARSWNADEAINIFKYGR